MARKRKVESSSTAIVDESDQGLYAVFRNSANELSQLYSQAISHNKLSFEAGQRHALEKLSNWKATKQQGGITVTASEISAYLQLIIGLSMLFISIAAMMVAFCAALIVTLKGRLELVIPIVVLACIPVTLFMFLQFPLLVEIAKSTYGPSIFDRKMKPWY